MNYDTSILLMVFVLPILMIEGGTANAIFLRCFVAERDGNQTQEKASCSVP
uniref:Uncharacterized protein n=1 Tax=Brassica oleracea TaxID=3712 RepID=A0A3P6EQH4_BRAOL|nr:unnamed protein product [Brassica oleracea]